VYSADCVPILIAAQRGEAVEAVMAVHAGWRGAAQQIAKKSLRRLSERLGPSPDLRYFAAIGPCISFANFEVGEDVISAFPGALSLGLAVPRKTKGKFLFDLPGENARQLRQVATDLRAPLELETLGHCTVGEPDRFPSYRREGAKAGRILSYLRFTG
jgi:copper oxidase (laccase) domain-containing protein